MAAGRLNDRTPIVLNWGPGWIFYLPGENERLDLNSDLHGLEPSVGGQSGAVAIDRHSIVQPIPSR